VDSPHGLLDGRGLRAQTRTIDTEERTSPATVDPSRTVEIVALEPTIGGEVHGLDLHQALSPALIGELRRALLERKVLAFRRQHLSPDELEHFTRYLGEPFGREDYAGPDVFGGNAYVGKVGPTPPGARPTTWHMGGTWQPHPLAFELLLLAVVPATGGATLFADLQAAYDDLSEPVQQLVSRLGAAHSTQVVPSGRSLASGDVFDPAHWVEHPLVIRHPESAKPGLYLTSRITHLLGVSSTESAALLSFLRAHASAPKYQYRHRWQAGDLVVWDNRAVWHCAVDDYGDAERWGYKTAVVSEDWVPSR
jgi:alpha-ketoglutarate-dependent taurine dioxygenase